MAPYTPQWTSSSPQHVLIGRGTVRPTSLLMLVALVLLNLGLAPASSTEDVVANGTGTEVGKGGAGGGPITCSIRSPHDGERRFRWVDDPSSLENFTWSGRAAEKPVEGVVASLFAEVEWSPVAAQQSAPNSPFESRCATEEDACFQARCSPITFGCRSACGAIYSGACLNMCSAIDDKNKCADQLTACFRTCWNSVTPGRCVDRCRADAAAAFSGPPTTDRDTEKPVVQAIASRGWAGTTVPLRYTVSDNSGVTTETLRIFLNGRLLFPPHILGLGPAVAGKEYAFNWNVPSKTLGLFNFCVTASDAAGNEAEGCASLAIESAPVPDLERPDAWAIAPSGSFERSLITLGFRGKDDSEEAKFEVILFQDGEEIFRPPELSLRKATGAEQYSVTYTLRDERFTGPFYFCVIATDAAGKTSDMFSGHACVWLSIIVPIEEVSNGCGGAQWGDAAANVQNWFLDTQTYSNLPPGQAAVPGHARDSYTVSFREACNLHDAGYAGVTVKDKLHGDRVVDFRTWSRDDVDAQLEADMSLLCANEIGDRAWRALQSCQGDEWERYKGTPGAHDYYIGVQLYAGGAFDWDLTMRSQTRERNPQQPIAGGDRKGK